MPDLDLALKIALFGLLALSLLLQLRALGRARAGGSAAQDAVAEVRRRTSNELEELRQEVQALRALLTRQARGLPVTAAMIEDGQLWEDLDGAEAERRVAAGALPLDVRTEVETRSGMVPGALWIPMDQIEERLDEVPRDRPLLVYCAGGARSAAVCEALAQRPGFPELLNLDAGLPAWPGPLERPST